MYDQSSEYFHSYSRRKEWLFPKRERPGVGEKKICEMERRDEKEERENRVERWSDCLPPLKVVYSWASGGVDILLTAADGTAHSTPASKAPASHSHGLGFNQRRSIITVSVIYFITQRGND